MDEGLRIIRNIQELLCNKDFQILYSERNRTNI